MDYVVEVFKSVGDVRVKGLLTVFTIIEYYYRNVYGVYSYTRYKSYDYGSYWKRDGSGIYMEYSYKEVKKVYKTEKVFMWNI